MRRGKARPPGSSRPWRAGPHRAPREIPFPDICGRAPEQNRAGRFETENGQSPLHLGSSEAAAELADSSSAGSPKRNADTSTAAKYETPAADTSSAANAESPRAEPRPAADRHGNRG